MAANKFYDVIPGGPAPGMQPGCIGPYIIFDPDGPCLYAWDSRLHVWEKMCIIDICGPVDCAADADLNELKLIYCNGEDACKGGVPDLVAFILGHIAVGGDSGVATDISVTPTVDPATGNVTYSIVLDVRYADGLGIDGDNNLVVVPAPDSGIAVGPGGVSLAACQVPNAVTASLTTFTIAGSEVLVTYHTATGECVQARMSILDILRRLLEPGDNVTFSAGPSGEIVVNADIECPPIAGALEDGDTVWVCEDGERRLKTLAFPAPPEPVDYCALPLSDLDANASFIGCSGPDIRKYPRYRPSGPITVNDTTGAIGFTRFIEVLPGHQNPFHIPSDYSISTQLADGPGTVNGAVKSITVPRDGYYTVYAKYRAAPTDVADLATDFVVTIMLNGIPYGFVGGGFYDSDGRKGAHVGSSSVVYQLSANDVVSLEASGRTENGSGVDVTYIRLSVLEEPV